MKQVTLDREAQEPTALLDIRGVARYLGVTERHIRKLVQERRIPHVRWGRLIRFDTKQVAAWVNEASVSPREHPRRYW